jgi:hypothetical protein
LTATADRATLGLVSPDTLPYTLLILLVELAVGSLVFVTVFDARGQVTHGYVQMGAVVVVPTALGALLVAFAIEAGDSIDGFTLRPGALDALRVALVVFTAIAAVNLVASFAERMRAARLSGVAGGAIGAIALAILAALVAVPAWSYAGVLGSMLASAVVLGGSLMAMSWGHWYLTNSGLPKEPLEQMSLVVLGALLAQAAFVLVAAAAPVREVPLTQAAFGVELGENPAFWFRVGVGLVFPLVLAWLAWRAAAIRGMMSATGLLYIAVGAVLAGEILARGLLFATGAAV